MGGCPALGPGGQPHLPRRPCPLVDGVPFPVCRVLAGTVRTRALTAQLGQEHSLCRAALMGPQAREGPAVLVEVVEVVSGVLGAPSQQRKVSRRGFLTH